MSFWKDLKEGVSDVWDTVSPAVAVINPAWAATGQLFDNAINSGDSPPAAATTTDASGLTADQRVQQAHEDAYGTEAEWKAREQAQTAQLLKELGVTVHGDYEDLPASAIPIPPLPGRLNQQAARDQGYLAQQQQYVNDYKNSTDATIADLRNTNAGLNASDQALIQQARDAFNNQVMPASVAAQAYADPAAIAAQNQALGMLFDAAGGSLDVSSNPEDVARQQQVYGMLMGAAGGSLDAHTNPEDLARQKQAADKLWSLTDPEMTAQERFLMEVARTEEERDRRATMDAKMRNLAERGQLGSGGEIGAMLGAQQTTSQNRMLQDLGAQAQAVARSQNSLGLYSNLATQMRNASDAMTSGNMNRRLSGMDAAGGLATSMRNEADAVMSGNMNRRLSATDAAGGLSTNMRNASFNEAFSRGSAEDLRNRAENQRVTGNTQFLTNSGMNANTASGNRASNASGLAIGQAGGVLSGQTGLTSGQLGAGANADAREDRQRAYEDGLISKAQADVDFNELRAALNKPTFNPLKPGTWFT